MNAKFKKLLVMSAMALALAAVPGKASATAVNNGYTVNNVQFVTPEAGATKTKVTVTYTNQDGKQEKKEGTAYVYEEVKDALKGKKDEDFSTKSATCKDDGRWYFFFEDMNGDWWNRNFGEAANAKYHKWEKGVIVDYQLPTCKEEGWVDRGEECSVCHKTQNVKRTITKATGEHTPLVQYPESEWHNVTVDTKTGEATLVDKTKDGTYQKKTVCSVCGEVLDKDTIPVKAIFHEETTVVRTETFVTEDDATAINTRRVKTSDGKTVIGLIDCTKKGTYIVKSYDRRGVEVTSDTITINAGTHTVGIVAIDKKTLSSTKDLAVVGKDGKTKGGDAIEGVKNTNIVTGKVVNLSCKNEGSYEKVVLCEVCKKEISREKVTVAKSNIHSYTTKEANPTYTCEVNGTVDIVTYCEICGDVKSSVTKSHKSVPHQDSVYTCEHNFEHKADPLSAYDTTKEDIVEATDHHTGSFDSVKYCQYGVEHHRKHVTTEAKNPNKFNFEFVIHWNYTGEDNEGYANSAIREDDVHRYITIYNWRDGKYVKGNTITKINDLAEIWAVPTDSDLTEEEVRAYTYRVHKACDVKEDKEKRVEGDACNAGSRTYYVSMKGFNADTYEFDPVYNEYVYTVDPSDLIPKTVKVPALSGDQTYAYQSDNYTGHQPSKWTLAEDGKSYVITCTVCGEVLDQNWIDATDEEKKDSDSEKIDISNAVIANEGETPYRGEYQPIPYTVTVDGKVLTWHVDYEVTNAKQNVYKGVGWHGIEIVGKGNYTGTAKGKLWIVKGTNKVKVNVSKKTFKAAALKKAAQSFEVKVTKKAGSLKATSSAKKYVKVKKVETGVYKITVKKGTPAGKYTVTFNAAESKNYTAAKKTVKITVK